MTSQIIDRRALNLREPFLCGHPVIDIMTSEITDRRAEPFLCGHPVIEIMTSEITDSRAETFLCGHPVI